MIKKEFDFSQVGKRVPYVVNDGFFEKVTSDVLCKVRNRRKTRVLKRVFGVAASVLLICGVSMLYFGRHTLSMDELITQMSDSELEDLMLITENDVLVNEEL